jgi:tetratricopeptide (TPR) repeat protein
MRDVFHNWGIPFNQILASSLRGISILYFINKRDITMKQIKTKLAFIVTILMLIVTSCTKNTEIPITTSSDEALKLFLDGRNRSELLEFGTSAKYFDQAIEKDDNFALAHLYRYRYGTVDFENNIEHLEKAVELTDEVSEGEKYLILYQKAQFDGDGAKRKEYLDKLLELFPSDKRVQHIAGSYFRSIERDNETALKYFNQAIKIDKNFAPAYNLVGYLNMDLGNYDKAEKVFKKQIELIPKHPNPYDSYGEFLQKVGKYDESIEQYNKAFETDKTFITAILRVGDNYVLKCEYDTAREYYLQQYDLADEFWDKVGALYQIASSYVIESKIEEAINVFTKYRDLAEENNNINGILDSYQSEGFVLAMTGRTDKGLKLYQQALKIATQTDASEPLKTSRIISAKFSECQGLLYNNNLEEALVKIEELQKITDERELPNATRWINLLNGILQDKKGNFKQAVEFYSKSWPDISMVKYHIANAYRKMGDKKKANQITEELKNWNKVDLNYAMVKYKM